MSRARDTADQINRVNSSAADATAITVDSSENVLIGKTSADGTGSTGHDIRATGLAYHTVDGGDVKVLNRLNSDGSILSIRKDNTTVGSIGVVGSDILFLANPDGTGCGLNFDGDNPKINPTNGSGSGTNGIVDLGWSGGRFKDLFLSGGVYLGGTGSANKLSDYEEGSFTPAVSGLTFTTAVGVYVKIGKVCHIAINLEGSNNSRSGDIYISGLPFTSDTTSTIMPANSVPLTEVANISLASGYTNMYGRVNASDTRLQILQSAGTAHASMAAGGGLSSGAVLRTSFTYKTT